MTENFTASNRRAPMTAVAAVCMITVAATPLTIFAAASESYSFEPGSRIDSGLTVSQHFVSVQPVPPGYNSTHSLWIAPTPCGDVSTCPPDGRATGGIGRTTPFDIGHAGVVAEDVYGTQADMTEAYQKILKLTDTRNPSVVATVGFAGGDCYIATVGSVGDVGNCNLPTSKHRIAGWRQMAIDVTSAAVTLSVDGKAIYTQRGTFRFNHADLLLAATDISVEVAQARFDNLVLAPMPSQCTTPPLAPTGLTATATDRSVTLKWSASAQPSNCQATTHQIFENGSRVQDNVSGNTFVVTGLAPNTRYTFSVGAKNEFGTAPPLPVVTIMTGPPTDEAWSNHFFCPFVEINSNPRPNVDTAMDLGTSCFVFAFVVTNGSCNLSWEAADGLSNTQWAIDLANHIHSRGGHVIISFGGEGSREPAMDCLNDAALEAAYWQALRLFHTNRLDFDIEKPSIQHPESSNRRSRVLAYMQQVASARGEHLYIQFTLPVDITGLEGNALSVLQSAIQNGVTIRSVNEMTMLFSGNIDPRDMAGNAAKALAASVPQIMNLYAGQKSQSDVRAMLGATVLEGQNGNTNQVFTLVKDAPALVSEARSGGWNFLSMWNLRRDHQCSTGESIDHCSGVPESMPFLFSAVLSAFGR